MYQYECAYGCYVAAPVVGTLRLGPALVLYLCLELNADGSWGFPDWEDVLPRERYTTKEGRVMWPKVSSELTRLTVNPHTNRGTRKFLPTTREQ